MELNENEIALFKAVREGDLEIVELLLKNGANVNQVNDYEESSLHVAVKKGHLNIVELLLHHKDIKPNQVSYYKETALHSAIKFGNIEIVKLLLAKMSPQGIDQLDEYGETALHLFAENHKYEIVKLLLESGKCDLSGMGDVLSRCFSNDPDMLIKISQQKPGIFDDYVDQIETIAQEKDCPILLLYCGKEKLNINDHRSYTIEGKKSLIISSHDIPSKIISMDSVVKFLDYQSAFNLYQAFQGLNIASNPLCLYKISHTDFYKITLTLENGTRNPGLKESINHEYDFVWNQEEQSFDYSKSQGNQDSTQNILGNEEMMIDKSVMGNLNNDSDSSDYE